MSETPNTWSGFKPPGRPLPGNWDKEVTSRYVTGKKVIHVVIWDDNRLLMVKNKVETTSGFTKPSGWGIPTETVGTEESPYEAALRVIKEEARCHGSEIVVDPRPLLVTKTRENEVYHYLFTGTLEPFTEIATTVEDDGVEETTEVMFLDPELVTVPEPQEGASMEERMPFFTRNGKEERVYASHLGFAAYSRFHG